MTPDKFETLENKITSGLYDYCSATRGDFSLFASVRFGE